MGDEHERPTVEMAPLFPPAAVLEELENGAVPEPIEERDSELNNKTAPIASGATLLSLVAGRRTDEVSPIVPLPEHEPTVKTERPATMTLLGVAPITRVHRSWAPRMAMPALSHDARRTTAVVPARARRSMWSRVFGRVSALLRRVRWAYRRRRGVRATLRRLPTRT